MRRRIRIRSLISAIRVREKKQTKRDHRLRPITTASSSRRRCARITPSSAHRCHRSILSCWSRRSRRPGTTLLSSDVDSRTCVDVGLKYVNNDACYPSLIVVGQLMAAVMSGDYDMSQHRDLNLPDRRRLPRQQLHRLHPACTGKSRLSGRSGHLDQSERSGEEPGL